MTKWWFDKEEEKKETVFDWIKKNYIQIMVIIAVIFVTILMFTIGKDTMDRNMDLYFNMIDFYREN